MNAGEAGHTEFTDFWLLCLRFKLHQGQSGELRWKKKEIRLKAVKIIWELSFEYM